jgi:hypothetical protein
MRIVDALSRLMNWLSGEKPSATFTTNEVNKALLDDAPRVVRVTLWAIFAFFIAMIVWASLAEIDEVTRGEGRAIPSSRLQKVQNLEGGSLPKFLPMKAKWYKPVRRCCVWMTPVFALTPEKARPISWRSKHGSSA